MEELNQIGRPVQYFHKIQTPSGFEWFGPTAAVVIYQDDDNFTVRLLDETTNPLIHDVYESKDASPTWWKIEKRDNVWRQLPHSW